MSVMTMSPMRRTADTGFNWVRKVRDMLVPEFEALGFTTRWIAQDGVNRAGHLHFDHKGRKGTKRLLLIGHLDTVFEPDHPFQKFERLDADTVKGPGVGDDKGGIVTLLAALRAMAPSYASWKARRQF